MERKVAMAKKHHNTNDSGAPKASGEQNKPQNTKPQANKPQAKPEKNNKQPVVESTASPAPEKKAAPTHRRKKNNRQKPQNKEQSQGGSLNTNFDSYYKPKSEPVAGKKMSADEWMEKYFSSEDDYITKDTSDSTAEKADAKPQKNTKTQGKKPAKNSGRGVQNTKNTASEKQKTKSQKQEVKPEKQEAKSQKQTAKPQKQSKSPVVTVAKDPDAKVRIIPLGGLDEVGKNMTLIECGNDIIVVDCGLGFPEDDMPGIDLVIPDVTYLEENKDRVRGLVLTHGHEDHIGAIPYVLRNIDLPIYGTRLTLGIVKNKLAEVTLPYKPTLNCVSAGDVIRLGGMSVEFIHVNHSIADACALAIRTPLGTVIHSGDFKLDLSPIDGEIMDITRFGELGKEGVLMLMCESTNAERPGTTPSEKKVGASLEYIFTVQKEKRIVISTFSSNVHRVQQIIDVAAHHGRKVAITGRSMLNIVGAAVELGYMRVPEGVLIDIAEIRKYSPHEVALVTTGSQGEPMSALYRMAFGEHREVHLGATDVVVLSSSPIPGNEKLIGRIVNELCKLGVEVIRDAAVEVHVSGHACQEELKLLYALTKPKYFMPVHGEYKHMSANRDLALYMGMDPQNIFISEIGKVLEITSKGAKWSGTVPSGKVLIDGSGVGDVGNIVLRDRILLSQDGVILVVATVSSDGGYIMSGPDIVTRGFIYVRESEDLMEEMRNIAQKSMMSCMGGKYTDWFKIKTKVKDDMAKFIFSKTKRRPMIIPMIMNV